MIVLEDLPCMADRPDGSFQIFFGDLIQYLTEPGTGGSRIHSIVPPGQSAAALSRKCQEEGESFCLDHESCVIGNRIPVYDNCVKYVSCV